MNLFQLGEFTMHAGGTGKWKIECDALTDDDIECLAFMLSERVAPFGRVEGIPRGGLRIAAAMRQYVTPGTLGVLVVDDVCTTGTSFETYWRENKDSEYGIQGAVLFARGPCPSWVTPLFSLSTTMEVSPKHDHFTRDIKPRGQCAACDLHHDRTDAREFLKRHGFDENDELNIKRIVAITQERKK